MNKTELINAVVEKINSGNSYQHKSTVSEVLNAFEKVVEEALAAGNEVQLTGFGTFHVAQTAERQGRNPKTGEPLTIAASKAPKFKAAKAFKDAVNG